MTENRYAVLARREKRKQRLYLALPILSLSLFILLWILASRETDFPGPGDVYRRFMQLVERPIRGKNIFGHSLDSLRRIFLALLFNWTFGIGLGILMGWNQRAKALIHPLFTAFRAVPPLAWIPLITLWAGISELPKIIIVIIGSLASVVVNTQAGIENVEQIYLDVGTVFHANRWQKLFKIAIPSAMDAIFAGIRTSTSAAWMVVLAAEMLGARSGVGFLITRGMDSIDMPLVLLAMIAIGLVGAMLAILTQLAERILCPWTTRKVSS